MTAPMWYDNQPEPVRAILDLASLDVDHATLHRITATLAPDHADAIADISADLVWIDRLAWDRAADVLASYHGQRVSGIHLDQAADVLADELRASVLTAAQFVASLVVRKSHAPVGAR